MQTKILTFRISWTFIYKEQLRFKHLTKFDIDFLEFAEVWNLFEALKLWPRYFVKSYFSQKKVQAGAIVNF